MDEPTLKDVLLAIAEIKTDINDYKEHTQNSIAGIESRTSAVEQRMDVNDKAHSKIYFEVETLKQKQLSANLCITGISATPNEDLWAILSKVCDCLNTEYDENLFTNIYRTKGQFSNSIIVQCNSDESKHYFLAAKRTIKTIVVDQLGLNLPNGTNEININSQLTPYFSHLLYTARQAVKRSEITAAWFTSRGVFIRLNESESQPILITSIAELSLYVSTVNPSKRRASHEIDNPSKKSTETVENTATTSSINNQQQNQQQNKQRNQPHKQQQKIQHNNQGQQNKSNNNNNKIHQKPVPTPVKPAPRLLRSKSTITGNKQNTP